MISVQGISKRFRLYRSPADRLKEILLRRPFHTDFQALDDVSFELSPGQSLGVIGPNGAGKSTLLRILAGALLPDRGTVRATGGGRICLLSIGIGMDPNESGLRNIDLSGLVLGMTPAEIAAKRQAIIDFTELGDFIHEPVRSYSSGMALRLGFAVAIHADPACFIIDEAMAVGDAHFQQKCLHRIRAFRANGGSLILVSHDLNSIKLLTDRALMLHRGKVVEQGDPETVTAAYNLLIARLAEGDPRIQLEQREVQRHRSKSYGDFAARITRAAVVDAQTGASVISAGSQARIDLDVAVDRAIPGATIGILIRDRFGQDIFGTNTHHLGRQVDLEAGKSYRASFPVRLDLGVGMYTLTVAIHTADTHLTDCHHWFDNIAGFEIAGTTGTYFIGLVRLAPDFTLTESTGSTA